MEIIDMPFLKSTTTVKVHGAFTFLSAGDLIYRLDEALERVQQAKPSENVQISCHFRFLDTRCKKLVFKYLSQIEEYQLKNSEKHITINWKYDWFDDDIIDFGLLSEESFQLKFEHVEYDRADVV